ncbi:MAG: quinone-dependent dihydroorotate dehydrogenase, partial [Deltaproteobacteria bacterium]|nr:quinone-dependent dihydroorotate dehydrogenase [Deltaproteobacteria bacterium]
DPEKAHDQTLSLVSSLSCLEAPLEWLFAVKDPRLEVRLGPLAFPNPVGLAAGFDKNGTAIRTWPGFGFGFIEIGAVTAHPQPGQPRPRLFRLPRDQALINRLGFNNEGAAAVAARLRISFINVGQPKIPLGINIGRSKVVETKDAAGDYLFTFEKLFSFGDFFTVNVSSPNTPGLRDLQEKSLLRDLLQAWVKIAPDMDFSQVDDIIDVAQSEKVAGIIATNATAFLREKLVTPTHEPGGLSGKPLKALATSFIRYIYQATRGRLPIIGVGGIFTAEDAYEKIRAGASAVQILTGFVYEGPCAVKRINRGLLRLMERDGFKNISAAVGSGVRT